MKLEICIDVDDVDRAVEFYGRGLGLEIPQHEKEWAKAVLGEQVFWIMKIDPGPSGAILRDYKRHWTPIHLDFHVDDLDAARQTRAGRGWKTRSRHPAQARRRRDGEFIRPLG